jgi:transmembrane sensor
VNARVSPEALEQAAEWLVRLQDGATTEDHAACEEWRASDPQHALAWERAERLLDKLGTLPPELAMPVLSRAPDGHRAGRRAAVARIVTLMLTVPVAWGGWRYAQSQEWTADIRTAVGERRTVTLADGTSVTLNTASAIDVRFTATERLIVLRSGEILVRSGHVPDAGPLRVRTPEGVMEPLGTVFNVRRYECSTSLAVLEGAVRVTPAASAAAHIINAGDQTRFNQQRISPLRIVDPALSAWTRGMLLADQMRLDELVTELSRYRNGLVRVDPSVAALRVSGAFPIGDSERTLDMLVSTYPVDAVQRLRGYWITLVPRA